MSNLRDFAFASASVDTYIICPLNIHLNAQFLQVTQFFTPKEPN